MADRLEALLGHFPVRASLLHAGPASAFDDSLPAAASGRLHVIRRGAVVVEHALGAPIPIEGPGLLLFPRPAAHRLRAPAADGAEVVCADIQSEGGREHPLMAALPDVVQLPAEHLESLRPLLALLFEEAFDQRCGRREVLGRLFELVLIQVLRLRMESRRGEAGLMSGLAHPRLRLAITAMHEAPRDAWTLDRLAARAGMSRTTFAETFRTTVGCTPGEYLQRWRVLLVQKGLRSGKPLKLLVDDVGYSSESALSRAFKAQSGESPRQWKARSAA